MLDTESHWKTRYLFSRARRRSSVAVAVCIDDRHDIVSFISPPVLFLSLILDCFDLLFDWIYMTGCGRYSCVDPLAMNPSIDNPNLLDPIHITPLPTPVLTRVSSFTSRLEYFDTIEEEDSPFPEVRASVSNVDDPDMPAMTLRMWFVGLTLCLTST